MKERLTSSHKFKEEIIDLWKSGHSIGQIMEILPDTKRHMIRKFLRDENIYDVRLPTLTYDEISKMVEYYKNGNSVADCAKTFDISVNTTTRILRENDVNLMPSNRGLLKFIKDNNISREYLVTKANEGMINPICKELKTNYSRVYKLFEYFDIEFIPKPTPISSISDKMLEDILYMRDTGWTGAEIAREYGLGKHTISNILHKHKPHLKGSKTPIPPEMRSSFDAYAKKVRRLTEMTLRIHGLEKEDGKHWNHRFSVLDGWRNSVPVDIISNRINLELITAKENLAQKWHSKITIDDLRKEIAASF